MIPGPDVVVECPGCGALARYQTILSGNTFGRRWWSDDKVELPMLPQPPAFVQCHACHNCYWLAGARKLGSMPSRWRAFDRDGATRAATDPAWLAASEVLEPAEETYYAVLATTPPADLDEERHLRLLALQRRNDRWRGDIDLDDLTPDPENGDVIATGDARANLLCLVTLYDVTPGAAQMQTQMQMMKGEFLRALGDFDAAGDVFASVTAAPAMPYARRFARLCEHRISRVRLVVPP